MIIKIRERFLRLAPKGLVGSALCLSLLSLSLPLSRPAAQGRQLRSEIDLQLSSETVHEAAFGRSISTSTIAQNPSFAGSFEVANCNSISGWAEDTNNLNTAVHVNFFVGSTIVGTALANGPRNDVGAHGFDIPTPAALKDTQAHTISARVESSNNDILNSPRSLGPCVTPPDNVGTGVLLNVDFKINNGAASTKSRLASLTFSVTKVTGATSQDATSQVTHYRVREEPDSRDSIHDLSAQPWIPFTHGLIMELAERNAEGQRYVERRVAFQVKTAALTSSVVSDTITLEPVLKEYRVSASGNTHPLIQYAATQGFQFPLDYYETCKGDCPTYGADSSLASGTANVTVQGLSSSGDNTVACVLTIAAAVVTIGLAAPAAVLVCSSHPAPGPAGTCVTKADYLMFEGRSPNQFWRIKSINVSGASVHAHGANRFRLKFNHSNSDGSCTPGFGISVGDLVMEGPEVDDFVDPANPWKDAFVRPQSLTRPTILPGVRPPN